MAFKKYQELYLNKTILQHFADGFIVSIEHFKQLKSATFLSAVTMKAIKLMSLSVYSQIIQ